VTENVVHGYSALGDDRTVRCEACDAADVVGRRFRARIVLDGKCVETYLERHVDDSPLLGHESRNGYSCSQVHQSLLTEKRCEHCSREYDKKRDVKEENA